MGAACLGQLGAVGEGVDEGGQERLAERSAVLEHLHVCKAHPSRPVRAGRCGRRVRGVRGGGHRVRGACRVARLRRVDQRAEHERRGVLRRVSFGQLGDGGAKVRERGERFRAKVQEREERFRV